MFHVSNYVTTAPKRLGFMMQRILSTPEWEARMTPTDFRAITPLVWEHINPYGRYELHMETRLAI
jgi:hypothetical protein